MEIIPSNKDLDVIVRYYCRNFISHLWQQHTVYTHTFGNGLLFYGLYLFCRSVFPCGDSMVAIMDDREDVWGRCPNLVHVKPYIFFSGTTDINAPPPPPLHHRGRPNPPRQRYRVGGVGKEPPDRAPAPTGKGLPTRKPAPVVSTEADSTSKSENSPNSNSSNSSIDKGNNDNNNGNNNNNNNNSNDNSGDEDDNKNGEAKVKAESGTSDTSSDSEDSISSSSGIDDTLFDQLPSGEGEESGNPLRKTDSSEPREDNLSGVASVSGENISGNGKLEDQNSPQVSTTSPSPPNHATDRPVRRRVRKIEDPDDFLVHLLDIFERIHRVFYERLSVTYPEGVDAITSANMPNDSTHPNLDLKQIIPELRQSVLKDCRILFTGVVPTNMPPRKNPEWNTARAFGATIHSSLVPGLNSSKQEDILSATTHVIAGKPGTTKLQEARRMPGVQIVSPRWLWACAECWKKVEEEKFPAVLEKRSEES